jgi:hypothetical protein
MMIYVLIRDGGGLAVIPKETLQNAQATGDMADAEVIFEGQCEDCLAAMDGMGGHGGN